MPRNVRNFWLELEVDGKKSRVATGPRRSDGTFSCRVLIRENGRVSDRAVTIYGVVRDGGSLEIRADSDEPEHKASGEAIVLLRGKR
jgi:hypothetical protein